MNKTVDGVRFSFSKTNSTDQGTLSASFAISDDCHPITGDLAVTYNEERKQWHWTVDIPKGQGHPAKHDQRTVPVDTAAAAIREAALTRAVELAKEALQDEQRYTNQLRSRAAAQTTRIQDLWDSIEELP